MTRPTSMIVALVALAPWTAALASAKPPKKACAAACTSIVQACKNTCAPFGGPVGSSGARGMSKACETAVLKNCRSKGTTACEVVPTTSTTTTSTTTTSTTTTTTTTTSSTTMTTLVANCAADPTYPLGTWNVGCSPAACAITTVTFETPTSGTSSIPGYPFTASAAPSAGGSLTLTYRSPGPYTSVNYLQVSPDGCSMYGTYLDSNNASGTVSYVWIRP